MQQRFLSTFLLVAVSGLFVESASVQNPRIFTRALAPIDELGQFLAEWTVNLDAQSIAFELVVETLGYVGFGFSPVTGGMANSDMVIGGVYDDGQAYFADRQGLGHSEPLIDIRQDYELTLIMQNATHTRMGFNRLLDTGDTSQDVVIRDEETTLIWGFGSVDVVEYHRQNRGAYRVNLLRP